MSLKCLDASFNRLSRFEEVALVTNLRQLNVSHNCLTSLKDVDMLRDLEFLNASCNKITSISGLGKLKKLRHLYLFGNKIKNLEELCCIGSMSSLEKLYFRYNDEDNPIVHSAQYKALVSQYKPPSLRVLDCSIIVELPAER